MGYAPKDSTAFRDFCQQKGLKEELLFELGMLKRKEDGTSYPMFRERIMIPIRNRWGRIIAYTARYIGANPNAPKYINSATSVLYTKGELLFGIDRAFRLRDAENFIIVEGAPDVLRLQSIGLENTVASLGTSWNENQLNLLKRYKSSLCFIPDSDVAPEGQYGPGFKAVMECGTLAIRKGFHATVKELPFGTRELTEEELASHYEGENIPPNAPREVPVKQDADSYILSEEIYRNLKEKHFIVWLAEKQFATASSLLREINCVNQIADLLRYVKDQFVYEQCIEQLGKDLRKGPPVEGCRDTSPQPGQEGQTADHDGQAAGRDRCTPAAQPVCPQQLLLLPWERMMKTPSAFPTFGWNPCSISMMRITVSASSGCSTPSGTAASSS